MSSEFLKYLPKDHTVDHPSLCQTLHHSETDKSPFSFVIGADTQLGMKNRNVTWNYEIEYMERAMQTINSLVRKPAFVCMCGDLVDMEPMMYSGKTGTLDENIQTQSKQFDDFQSVWKNLCPEIPMLCLCGNHDVGNRPNADSIKRYTSRFGDDYFAFWCHQCYMICLNSNLYNDSSDAPDLFEEQHQWLEERLRYARESNATRIFLFSHHPWFLRHENETAEELVGRNEFGSKGEYIEDGYFSIPLHERTKVMSLCKQYQVDACFSGHYHQNNVAQTSWGMPMIVTGAICNWLIESTGKDLTIADNQTPGAGIRVVEVNDQSEKGFTHRYELV
jgi:hypothetical protein